MCLEGREPSEGGTLRTPPADGVSRLSRQSREVDDGWSPAGLRGHGVTGVRAPAFERTEVMQPVSGRQAGYRERCARTRASVGLKTLGAPGAVAQCVVVERSGETRATTLQALSGAVASLQHQPALRHRQPP
jgi:hypothetical protein